jgi:hypothetical protein
MSRRINRKRTRLAKLARQTRALPLGFRIQNETIVPLGEAIDLADTSPSPEDLLLSKDTLRALSDEAKDLVSMIMSCPEELFMNNGKLKRKEFQDYCKESKGWKASVTRSLMFELGFFLQHAFVQ